MADPVQGSAPAALSPHDQAMIDKVDATNAAVQVAAGVTAPVPTDAPAGKPQRPENVPEKFWDAEKGVVRVDDLVKSYGELERGKSAPQEPQAETPAGQVEAIEAAARAGLKEEDLSEAFSATGDFTPEQYTALEKAGYSNQLVKQYIAGVKAQGELLNMQAYATAGGEESFKSMMAWAGANLNQAEIAAYDKAVMGNTEDRKQAILGLKARFEASQGSEPQLLRGDPSAGATAESFGSRAEMTEAMRDPRYRKDPAYRASVERKVGNSNF